MHIWGCPHDARTIAYDVYTIARQSAIYIYTYIHTYNVCSNSQTHSVCFMKYNTICMHIWGCPWVISSEVDGQC